jgi:hypothetical protein
MHALQIVLVCFAKPGSVTLKKVLVGQSFVPKKLSHEIN